MEIGQLITLVHVAELGSLNKASERLHIVQPALSRQIRLLERELGVQLFERHGRGMVPTGAGAQVVARAVRIMQEIGQIRADMARERAALSGEVVIGLSPNVAELLIVPLARRLASQHPSVKLKFATAYAGSIQEWLQTGDVDLAVIYEQNKVTTIKYQPLLREPVSVIVSPVLLPPGTNSISFRALSNWPLILPSERHSLRGIIERIASEHGVELQTRYEVDDFNAVRDLVSAGLGVALLPAAGFDLEAGTLTALPLHDPTIIRLVALASSIMRPLTATGAAVAQAVVDEVRTLVADGVWAAELMLE